MNFKIHNSFSSPLTFTLAMLIALALYIQSSLEPIEPKSEDVAENVFSAARGQSVLDKILFERKPHSVDSPLNRVVEKRIVQQLKAMGYVVEIQQANVCDDYPVGVARCTQVRNIVTKIKGRDELHGKLEIAPSAILLSAHYDSVDAGYGANDAGMAVATLLEIARLLSLQPPPKNSIILLFNEGEEFGLFGAKAFMRDHSLAKSIKLALNVEARGTQGKSVMFETGLDSGWLVNAYLASTPSPLSSSLFYEVYKALPNDTDLTIYKKHGLQGLNFAHGGREYHYHTPLDSFEHFPLGTLQHHGENVWGVLQIIKNKDISQVKKNNLIYTDILGLFSVQWQESTSFYASILLWFIALLVLRRLRSTQNLKLSSIVAGFILSFAWLIVLSAVAWLLQNLTQLISAGISPWRSNNFPMQIMLWSGLTLTVLAIMPKRLAGACPLSLSFGIFVLLLLLAQLSSLYLVGISFLFLIPASVMALGFVSLSILKNKISIRLASITLVSFCLLSGIVFLPIVYVLELMVGYQMSLAIGLMLSFVLINLVPLNNISRQYSTSSRWQQGFLFAIFTLGLLWTSFQAAYTQEVPQSFNITHLQDQQGHQFVLAGSKNNPIPETLRSLMKQAQLKKPFVWSNRRYFIQPIDGTPIPLSDIKAEKDLVIDNHRQLEFKIQVTDINFRELYLYIEQTSGLQRIRYQEQIIDYAKEKAYRNGYYQFHCRGQSCASAQLSLEFDNLNQQSIYFVYGYAGLPASSQKFSERRGSKATQRQFGDRRLVVRKVLIEANSNKN